MPVCPACGQENPEVAKFCLACGGSVAGDQQAGIETPRQERKVVTGVFVDVVGSTARAEALDPEDVRAMLAPYHARARAELERFGGTVEKFIGDAVFALFGAPVSHEDDAERAVRAGFSVLEAVAELNRSDEWLNLHLRVGVHTGEALVMLDASASAGDWLAAGDIVNTAARIQSAAPPDSVLVGDLTRTLTKSIVEYDSAEPIAAKGKSERVRVWLARRLREEGRRRRGSDISGPVGRTAELLRLLEAWEEVRRARRPTLVTVVGAPGIGKSTLIGELRAHARKAGGRDYGSRCLPYGEGITYWPVTEIVKSMAAILVSDAADDGRAKLAALIERLPTTNRDELRTVVGACAALLGSETSPGGTYTTGRVGQEELHWGLRRAFQLLATETPLILVIEDLHWAEPTLLKLIRFLAESEDGPMMILCSGRPELRERSAEFVASGVVIELDTLDAEAARELLVSLVGSLELAETPAAGSILRVAGGNPLFLGELVEAVRERVATADGWAEEEALKTLGVPTNLQGLIASRLDQLRPRVKGVAQHASVVGHVFWPGAVAHIEERNAATLSEPLDELEHRDFVHPAEASSMEGEVEYSFKHILVRDVAYGSLPKGSRIRMHMRFAEWLLRVPGPSDEFVEVVAWHLEQACHLCTEVARPPIEPPIESAVEALTRAAAKAERREGLREANRFYERALELVGQRDPELATFLRVRHGGTMTGLGELKAATEELVNAETAARHLGRGDLRRAALVALAEIDRRQGRVQDARSRLTEAAASSADLDDLALQIRLRFVRAAIRANADGETDAALADLGDATRLGEELNDLSLLLESELRTAALLMNAGRMVEAESVLERCVKRAGAAASLVVEAEATSWLAGMKYYLGDTEGGRRLALQAATWLERTGDNYFLVQNLVWLSAFALLENDPEAAETQLRRALPTALELGGWVVVQVYRYLTEALVATGRVEEARELSAFAARNLPEEDPYARTELLLAEAAVATATNEQTAAATAFAEALRVLEDLNMPAQLAESRLAFARSLAAFGDHAAAAVEFTRARSAFARMGAQTLVDVIDEDLRALEQRRAPAGT
jgi:class 3 adenylate cyclase/tetratricopeptide (TPR) repeat protein